MMKGKTEGRRETEEEERREGRRKQAALMGNSAAAKMRGHVPNPIIPNSASESDYKAVRALCDTLTPSHITEAEAEVPEMRKDLPHRHRNSMNGWARPESRFLAPRPSSLHPPKSGGLSEWLRGVTITPSNTPHMGRKRKEGWRKERDECRDIEVFWQEIRNMKGQTDKFLLWTARSCHWTPA